MLVGVCVSTSWISFRSVLLRAFLGCVSDCFFVIVYIYVRGRPLASLGHVTVFVAGAGRPLDVLLVDQRLYALLDHRDAGRKAHLRLLQDLRQDAHKE